MTKEMVIACQKMMIQDLGPSENMALLTRQAVQVGERWDGEDQKEGPSILKAALALFLRKFQVSSLDVNTVLHHINKRRGRKIKTIE